MKQAELKDQSAPVLGEGQEKAKNSYLTPKQSVSEFFCRLFSCCCSGSNKNSKSAQKPAFNSSGFSRLGEDASQAQHPMFGIDIEELGDMPPLDLDMDASVNGNDNGMGI